MRRPSHATVVAYVALFFAMTGTAAAATGGTFVLGRSNAETSTATVSNSRGTPLSLKASSGHAPLSVNSSVRVPRLNADLLDGLHSSAFLRAEGKATDADKLDGLDSTAFLPATGKAADADKLDGQDSFAFQQRVTGTCGWPSAVSAVGNDGSVTCTTFKSDAKIVTGIIGTNGGYAVCPSGYQAVGGGFDLPYVENPDARDYVRESRPASYNNPDMWPDAWYVLLEPAAANNYQLNNGSMVYAVCTS